MSLRMPVIEERPTPPQKNGNEFLLYFDFTKTKKILSGDDFF